MKMAMLSAPRNGRLYPPGNIPGIHVLECGESECDREVSIMRRLWRTGGCCDMGENVCVGCSMYHSSVEDPHHG